MDQVCLLGKFQDYHWSIQDIISVDNVPCIGSLPSGSENSFIATGFQKWGMTTGTTAAMILMDLALENPMPGRKSMTHQDLSL
jgi:glycine/D-amino acid oxidase-like deaminating enzyme